MTSIEIEREWWRFWADTFKIGDTFQEYWFELMSKLITPCNRHWKYVYHQRYIISNDNHKIRT